MQEVRGAREVRPVELGSGAGAYSDHSLNRGPELHSYLFNLNKFIL